MRGFPEPRKRGSRGLRRQAVAPSGAVKGPAEIDTGPWFLRMVKADTADHLSRRLLDLGGIGLAIGVGGALGFTRLMESLLFGITPLDPVAFTAMPLVLAAAAVLASYLPARRAVAVDPVETLRAE